ncbi:cytochrome P460 family protein [Sphingobium sp.]|uniref:cytochrome P460 family protein n=1 Tax=Sphingobium sp. TaxID=1912891 RepID=UPI0035C73E82
MIRTGTLALAITIFGVSTLSAAKRTREEASPVYGVTLPKGYRHWTLISVAQENGRHNDIRAILGNAIAVKAFREKRRPFPDGAVIVRLAWRYQSSPRNDAVFPAPQSFIAGEPTNIQVSVKDSRRYPGSGGWGYGQFERGIANPSATLAQSCFACHAKLKKGDDLVFTDWAP